MRKIYNLNIKNFVEIDKFAEASYCAIHGVNKSINLGDITKIDPKKLPKDINCLVGGSPCTSFSSSGKQEGSRWKCNNCGKVFDPLEIDDLDNCCCPDCKSIDLIKTESSLIVDWLRIFIEVNPKLAIFENVKNLLSKRFEKSFKLFEKRIQELGYNTYYKCMNAKDYGIPQNRERVIFIAIRKDVDNGKFRFPEPRELKLTINDLLEENYDIYKYTGSNIIIDNKISPYIRKHIDRDINEIITSDKGIYRMKCTSGFNDNAVGIKWVPTLRARNSSTIALQTYDTLQGKKYHIKRLTPLETFRFMGFSDEDYLVAAKVNSKTQLYKQCGNSIVVNVVEEVLYALFKVMPELFVDVQIIDLFAGIGAFEKAFKRVIDDANAGYIVPCNDQFDVLGHCTNCDKVNLGDKESLITDGMKEMSENVESIFGKLMHDSLRTSTLPLSTLKKLGIWMYKNMHNFNTTSTLIYIMLYSRFNEYERLVVWESFDSFIDDDFSETIDYLLTILDKKLTEDVDLCRDIVYNFLKFESQNWLNYNYKYSVQQDLATNVKLLIKDILKGKFEVPNYIVAQCRKLLNYTDDSGIGERYIGYLIGESELLLSILTTLCEKY